MAHKKIGFIGLGIMGKPMVRNLLKAGYPVIAYDVNAAVVDEMAKNGAEKGTSSKDVAQKSEVIITMLPNSPHVKAVVLGENGVIEGIKPGSIYIDMSSISPIVSREVEAELAKKNIKMLDAPVSGGEPKAVDGTLAIMVGGDEGVFDSVKEILFAMGSSVTLVGSVGSGNIAKLANQIMVASNIAGMSEALVLAAKAGVNPETVFKAVRGGLAQSTVLDVKAPMVLEGNYKPGFRIDLHVKDLQNVLDTASALDVSVPMSDVIIGMMHKLQEQGKGADDHGGLIQWFEEAADVKVRK